MTANISPVGDFPMGGVIERPVTAPFNLNAEGGRNFLADMSDKVPLLPRQVPCLRAMHDIDGKAVIVSALPGLCLAQTLHEKPLLLHITAINAVCEHRNAQLRHPLDEHTFELKQCRVSPSPVSTIVLTLVAFAGEE